MRSKQNDPRSTKVRAKRHVAIKAQNKRKSKQKKKYIQMKKAEKRKRDKAAQQRGIYLQKLRESRKKALLKKQKKTKSH